MIKMVNLVVIFYMLEKLYNSKWGDSRSDCFTGRCGEMTFLRSRIRPIWDISAIFPHFFHLACALPILEVSVCTSWHR